MGNINYKPMILEKLKEFSEEFPEYSMSEILFAILKSQDIDINNRSDFFYKVKDSDLYAGIERALIKERK